MFHKDLFVFDVIYNPQETRLLREAKEAGCKTGNGMYMLLYQGAASFPNCGLARICRLRSSKRNTSPENKKNSCFAEFSACGRSLRRHAQKATRTRNGKRLLPRIFIRWQKPFYNLFMIFLISPLSVLHQAVLYTVYNNGLSLPSAHHVFRSP